MSTQPEALRLADAICDYSRRGFESEEAAKKRRMKDCREAAAELRRLHAEVEEQCRLNGMGSEREAALMAKVERLERQVSRLHALNADLLEALKLALSIIGHPDDPHSQHIARIVAKVEGEA